MFYVSEDKCLGMLYFPPRLMVSEDLGISWSVAYEGDPLTTLPLVARETSGDFILANRSGLYRMSADDYALDKIMEVSDGNSPGFYVRQVIALEDGSIALSGQLDGAYNIRLVNSSGTIVRDEPVLGTLLEFIDGPEGLLALSRHNQFGVFTTLYDYELNLINDNSDSPNSRISLQYHGTRLFSNTGYSDDNGRTWTDFPDMKRGLVTILGNGNVHLLTDCFTLCRTVWISQDGGETFEVRGELQDGFNPALSHHTAAVGDSAVFLFRSKNNFYLSDGVAIWEQRGEAVGNPWANQVAAASINSVMLNTNLGWPLVTIDGESWSTRDFTECGSAWNIEAAQDGSFVTDRGCYSEDGGLTWTGAQFLGGRGPFINDQSLSIFEFWFADYEVHTSLDFGRSWSTVDTTGDREVGEYFEVDVTASGTIFITEFDDRLLRYDPSNNSWSDVMLEGGFIDGAASYSGEEFYVIVNKEANGESVANLALSYDDGLSFQEIELPMNLSAAGRTSRIETDHLDNVFIYTEKEVWMSPDQGTNWTAISPQFPELHRIRDIDISWDNYIFLSTEGTGILRSAEPLQETNILKILVYEDENDNCTYDAGEPGVKNIRVNIGELQSSTNAEGEINLFLNPGTFDIAAIVRNDLYASCNNTQQVTFNREGENAEVQIPLSSLEECADLNTGATIPFLRRCFTNAYHLEIYNEGTVSAENSLVTLELDPYFEYEACTFDLVSQNGNTYVFNVGTVPPGARVRGRLHFTLSCNADLGMSHYLTAKISSDGPNCTRLEGTVESFECRTNIGAYDPNDKSIYVDGLADAAVMAEDSEIDYLIRFQNTGTDTAFTVSVEDRLSEDFELSSLRPLAGSHSYDWSIDRNRILVVQFDNILLPDSTTNESGSHGFIKFRVALSEDRPAPGDFIHNTAEIYFDFNEPIITNTVETSYLCQHTASLVQATICPDEDYEGYTVAGTYVDGLLTELGCDSVRTLVLTTLPASDAACVSATQNADAVSLSAYPIPAQEKLNVRYNGNMIIGYTILDVNGRVVRSGIPSNNYFGIDITDLQSGLFFLNCKIDTGKIVGKKIVITK